MAKLKFLQGVYIPSLNKVVNHNDVLEIENEKLAKHFVESKLAEQLIEETPKKAVEKKTKKVAKDA